MQKIRVLLFILIILTSSCSTSIRNDQSNNQQTLSDLNNLLLNDTAKGIKALDSLQSTALANNNKKLAGLIFLTLGNHYQHLESYPEAYRCYSSAQNIFIKIHSNLYTAKCMVEMANIHFNLGNFPESLDYLQQAAAKYDTIHNIDSLIRIYQGIGSCYLKMHQYNTSLHYFKSSIAMLNSNTDLLLTAHSYNNMGAYYYETKNIDSAHHYLKKALNTAINSNYSDALSLIYGNYALIYYNNYHIDSARHYTDKAIHTANANSSAYYSALVYKGYYFEKNNQPDSAIHYFNQALNNNNKPQKYHHHFTNALLGIIKTSENTGAYETAYQNMKTLYYANDSIQNQNNKKRIKQLQVIYQLQQKQKEAEISQKRKMITLLSISGGLLFMLFIIALLYSRLRIHSKNTLLNKSHLELEKVKLNNQLAIKNRELEYKNSELTNFALSIVEKNQLLTNIKSDLIQLKPAFNNSTYNEQFNLLAVKLTQNIQLENDLKTFEKKVEQINHSFYHHLQQKFPQLTKKDLRLAALIRQGFSSKEIALLTNIETTSVEISRHRLRKKTKLTRNQNLEEFLSNF